MACTTCLVVFFTTLITVNGIILFGVGVTGIIQDKDTADYHKAPEFVLIVLGVTVFALSFLGTYAAIKKSECKLYSFASAMMVLSFFQFITAVVLFARKDSKVTASIVLITAVIQVVGAVLAYVVAIYGEIKICQIGQEYYGPGDNRSDGNRSDGNRPNYTA
ncbi:Hypothetical predicted protein [Cloeon dipterum]|uniref:Uncharacterized protein n=1 Tax=Cloeon dipterum TaxID=197152 RepID=A0A8S1D8A8_9INSE|nr:Hypothetical predicted protein [Cloeon dipterum]